MYSDLIIRVMNHSISTSLFEHNAFLIKYARIRTNTHIYITCVYVYVHIQQRAACVSPTMATSKTESSFID